MSTMTPNLTEGAPHISPTAASTRSSHIKPSSEFRENFNKLPFLLEHNLANHPLFTLPRLLQLAIETRRDRPEELYFDAGHNVPIGARWSEMDRPPMAEEAFERIQEAGAWIVLHQTQRNPAYAEVFHECMREFEALSGVDFNKIMRVQDALIFITSPNRTTTYHLDRECNYLLQINGSKTIYVFDQRDKEVVPETELERFWAVDKSAATYKPELQDRATPYRLVPGNGIHIPIGNPHWLQNDDNVSVSLSVNFTMKDSERGNIYRANYFLRKFGLNPQPPFQSPMKDAMKNVMMGSTYVPARSAIRTIRRLRGEKTRTS
jgi:hypothetical protein